MLIQEFEFALHCVTTLNPVTCFLHLPWVEYAHNSLTSSTTGLSTFEASLGYHPPLFLQNEVDFAVTSVQHHLQRCRHIWTRTREVLLKAVVWKHRYVDRLRRPAPNFTPGTFPSGNFPTSSPHAILDPMKLSLSSVLWQLNLNSLHPYA